MIRDKKILITGGLGFIGFNAALHFAKNNTVSVIDNCSRIGVEHNIQQLSEIGVGFEQIDLSQFRKLRNYYYSCQPDIIIHMAAQVAVTLSIENPALDYQTNLQGSFNLLELARTCHKTPIILYASTNKVYGQKEQNVTKENGRYCLRGMEGYSEDSQLDFETPYGCSKGAADQYFIDYCRTYGVPTVVFRQSCIYGPHQFGMEDQGWLAWFAVCADSKMPITVFGDGDQVRDVLYVDDLIKLYEKAAFNIDKVKGQAFNIGGGPNNTLSLNELICQLNKETGHELAVSFSDWRLGDQKVYVSDINKVERLLDWRPKVPPEEGVTKLLSWIQGKRQNIADIYRKQKERKEKVDVSIVIPARNEEECLASVLDEVGLLLENSTYRFEVVVVNDRSTDRTAEVAAGYPFAKLIDNIYSPGKGGALRSGFDIAEGEYIAMMDADFSHDAADLPYLIEEVSLHKGLVVGSRLTGGSEEYTRIRAFGNVILTWFFGFVHGRYMSDVLNGFKVFHRDVYHDFEYTSKNFEIEVELAVNSLRLKRPLTEVPSRERARMAGKMKSSAIKHGPLFLGRIIYERFRIPKQKSATRA